MFKQCNSQFNIERHLIPFLQECAFFAEISRHLFKIPTNDIPTAGVVWDDKTEQISMYYNPNYFETLSNSEIRGVITHEFYHLVFGHLASRRKKPNRLWNVATDLAINSIILENFSKSKNESSDSKILPDGVLIPGQWPTIPGNKDFTDKIEKMKSGESFTWSTPPEGRELTKEEKQGMKLAALIASFPKMQSSEWYFNKLLEESKNNKKSKDDSKSDTGDGDTTSDGFDEDWIESFDDHESWDNVSDEKRELIEGKIKSIIEKAAKHADQMSTGWGNIPAELREQIRASVSNTINWRNVLRQFVGSLYRGGRTTSIKRINRRYPYIHPGIKRGYMAKLLIARDESGSVSNEMLEEFFAELNTLTKKVEIDFLPFDCGCSESEITRWKKGNIPTKATMRTRGGGTDFNAPTAIFNDPKNRGRWDGMLILTDGMAPKPGPSRGRRGWILAKNCKLEFNTEELQVFVSKDAPIVGAWR